MTEQHAERDGSRIRHYLKMGTRRARLKEMLRLSAAVCQQKLSVEEACKQHGLKLDDVLRYLEMRDYLRSPPEETIELQAITETEASPLGVRVDRTI